MSEPQVAMLDFHKGEALFKLAAVYPTLAETIEEQVQNALDAQADRIEVTVDFQIRRCLIEDNGNGVGLEKFNRALNSVGKGIKDKDKLGRFGLGLISPLGKCDQFTFTSCPKPKSNVYQKWTFDSKKLKKMHHELSIPRLECQQIILCKKQEPIQVENTVTVWWRSQVEIINFTKDRALSTMTMESLKLSILDKYSAAMRRQRTKIVLTFIDEKGVKNTNEFIGQQFAGRKLDQVVIEMENSGKTTFDLYVTKPHKRTSKRLNILFGEANNDFRISTANFLRSTASDLLSDEIKDAFRSGLFEGEITSELATFNPSRKSFALNDALLDFCLCIEQWFEEHGKKHLNQEKEKREATRYQKLGIDSLQALEKILKTQDNSTLLTKLKESIRLGTIGQGHTNKKPVGEQEVKSLSTNGQPGVPRPIKSETETPRQEPIKDKPNHLPVSVQGPDGNRRMLVKSDSLGLQFAFADTGVSLWEFDTLTGTLYFNTTHPTWVACDKSDYKLKVLMETVAVQAISLEIANDKTFTRHLRLFADDCLDLTIQLLLSDGAISRCLKK